MASSARMEIDEVLRHFDELEDPRSTVNQRQTLTSVVVIAIMAILSGAGGPTAIAKWAKLKNEFLRGLLELPHGVPSKDVFRRVLMALKPEALQACFANWLAALRHTAVAVSEG